MTGAQLRVFEVQASPDIFNSSWKFKVSWNETNLWVTNIYGFKRVELFQKFGYTF